MGAGGPATSWAERHTSRYGCLHHTNVRLRPAEHAARAAHLHIDLDSIDVMDVDSIAVIAVDSLSDSHDHALHHRSAHRRVHRPASGLRARAARGNDHR